MGRRAGSSEYLANWQDTGMNICSGMFSIYHKLVKLTQLQFQGQYH